MSNPTDRDELIDWCLRRLGAPVIEINVDDEQVDDGSGNEGMRASSERTNQTK